jgi:hypothetical protein
MNNTPNSELSAFTVAELAAEIIRRNGITAIVVWRDMSEGGGRVAGTINLQSTDPLVVAGLATVATTMATKANMGVKE